MPVGGKRNAALRGKMHVRPKGGERPFKVLMYALDRSNRAGDEPDTGEKVWKRSPFRTTPEKKENGVVRKRKDWNQGHASQHHSWPIGWAA